MQANTSTNCATETTPLLQEAAAAAAAVGITFHGEEEDRNRGGGDGGWWRKVLVFDVEEAKNQVLFSLPMILTNVFYYSIPLVSVMFAGHLGQLQLAGATLANSWATVTGFAFMIGLSGALETLCGQGFGAKEYRMLALYMRYLIPGLFAYGVIQNILRFLQTQSIVMPLVLLSALPMALHFGIVYALVHLTSLGFKGAPLAASVSLWISMLLLALYVICSKTFEPTWQGFSSESFSFILSNLKLALPSAAMVCLEYWAFEILVFLAGLMPNAELTTSLIAICVNTETIAYMITYGFSAAASTRVSNELGSGNLDRAKSAMLVTLKLSVLLALTFVLALAFGHNIWAGFFSDSAEIIEKFASLTPFLAISITFDSVQGVLSGVVRGCGWQHLAVYANLATFYCIGMPIAGFLGFKLNLQAKGLWTGLICGLSMQASTLLLITLCRNWSKIDIPVNTEQETLVIV
ncbi:hypothetical protein LWI28_018178 [Acer negundo]|uniref:Protein DETOXIFICATION n=1 Tax=Acer negundo TaxID=4023 RepID=A0AAD5NXP9_ACENE|nr:hypothetical protein LWI28_018178 [Acer negundo]